MQKGGEGVQVQIACKIAYVINGRPLEICLFIVLTSAPESSEFAGTIVIALLL